MVTEQPHHQHLPEHGVVDPAESFEWPAEAETFRRCKFDSREHAEAADLFHHLVTGECLREPAAQLCSCRRGTRTERLALHHTECGESGPHRQAVLPEC